MSSSLTSRMKELSGAFGGLQQLVGLDQLNAIRQKISRQRLDNQLEGQTGVNRAAIVGGNALGEALGEMFGSRRQDPEAARAAQVDAARQAALAQADPQQDQIVPPPPTPEGEAFQAAQAKVNPARFNGTTPPLDLQEGVVKETIGQLLSRGLADEARSLLPNLQLIREKKAEEQAKAAALRGAKMDNDKEAAKLLYGEVKNVKVNGIPGVLTARQMPDGSIETRNPLTGEVETYSVGDYQEATLTGTPGDFDSKSEKTAVARSIGGQQTLMGLADLRQEVINNPSGATLAGTIARVANQVVPDLNMFIGMLRGNGLEVPVAENRQLLNKEFARKGVSNELQKRAIEKMAYALASSREDGKLSVSDVELAANAFGIGLRSPVDRIQALDQVFVDLKNSHQILVSSLPGIESHPSISAFKQTIDVYDKLQAQHPVRRLGETVEAFRERIGDTQPFDPFGTGVFDTSPQPAPPPPPPAAPASAPTSPGAGPTPPSGALGPANSVIQDGQIVRDDGVVIIL